MGSPQPHDPLLFQFHRDCHCEAPSTGYKLSLINMRTAIATVFTIKIHYTSTINGVAIEEI